MAKTAKSVTRARATRKTTGTTNLPKLQTMQELVAAIGGAEHISSHISTTDCVMRWFERGYVERGYGLQVLVSLLRRGYTLDRINSKLFGHPAWTSYTVPVDPPRRRRR